MGIGGVRWLLPSLLGVVLQVTEARAQISPPAMAPPPGREWVHVTLPPVGRGAQLDAFEGPVGSNDDDERGWRKLCVEPCTMWIPSGTRLRVSGNLKTTDAFALPPSATGISLRVKPSNLDARGPGIALTAISGGCLFFGIIINALGNKGGSGGEAGAFVGVPLVGVAAGVTLILLSRSSRVTAQANPAALSPPPPVAPITLARGFSLGLDGLHF